MRKQMLGSAFVLLAFALSLPAKEPNQQSRITLASASPQLQPVASLALSESPQSGQGEAAWASVAFTSETSIAVGACLRSFINQMCSIVLVRWKGDTIQPFAQTLRFDSGVSLHPASEGRILVFQSLSPTVLYSADLSTVNELPKNLSRFISPSGKTVAEWARGSWKLYRLSDQLEPLREGTGDLQSVSDEVVLIQDRKVMRVETLDGKQLGSFSVPSAAERYYASTGSVGNNKLYLDDCNSVRIVDFSGRTLLKMHPRKGCSFHDTSSSADGRRMLFDFTNHKASGLKHVLESVQTVTTLGMMGPEDVNREEVRVFDTVTGKACFNWHRSFPATYSQVRSAAISPSGEFVAVVEKDKLSIYRLPADCDESERVPPDK
jgi:hypothetical protein